MKYEHKSITWAEVERIMYKHKFIPSNIEKYGWKSEPIFSTEEIQLTDGMKYFDIYGYTHVVGETIYEHKKTHPKFIYNLIIEQD